MHDEKKAPPPLERVRTGPHKDHDTIMFEKHKSITEQRMRVAGPILIAAAVIVFVTVFSIIGYLVFKTNPNPPVKT
jgi:hypothetical protein